MVRLFASLSSSALTWHSSYWKTLCFSVLIDFEIYHYLTGEDRRFTVSWKFISRNAVTMLHKLSGKCCQHKFILVRVYTSYFHPVHNKKIVLNSTKEWYWFAHYERKKVTFSIFYCFHQLYIHHSTVQPSIVLYLYLYYYILLYLFQQISTIFWSNKTQTFIQCIAHPEKWID